MSEQAPKTEYSQTADTGEDVIDDIGKFKQVTYKNGVKHLYGVDAEGKSKHLSHEALLNAYGHSLKENKQNTADYVHNNDPGAEDLADLLIIGNTIDFGGKQYEIVDFDNIAGGEPLAKIRDNSTSNPIDMYYRVDDLVANGAKSVESTPMVDDIAFFKTHFGTIAKLLQEGNINEDEAMRFVEKIKRDLSDPKLDAIDSELIVRNFPAFYDSMQNSADPDAQHNSAPFDANMYFNEQLVEVAKMHHDNKISIAQAVAILKALKDQFADEPAVAGFDTDQVDESMLEMIYQTEEAINVSSPDASVDPYQGSPDDPNAVANAIGPDSAVATPDVAADTNYSLRDAPLRAVVTAQTALNNMRNTNGLTPEQKKARRAKILIATMATLVVGAIVAAKFGIIKMPSSEAAQSAGDAAGGNSGGNPSPELPFEFSKKALHITKGEGWYKTFKELGINPADYAKLLATSGPDLVDMGIAYEAPDLGGYGISHSGKMPIKALELLKENAAKL